MKNIILTSCGIIDREFKEQFYRIINKEEIKDKKVLYITTASDGENDSDKSWMDNEYRTILNEEIITKEELMKVSEAERCRILIKIVRRTACLQGGLIL